MILEEIKTLLKHTTIYGVGNILAKMVGFFMIPFYTHYLTPADYGTLELLDLSLSLVSLMLTMWLNTSIIRHYNDYESLPDRNQAVSTTLIFASCMGMLVAAVAIHFSRPLSNLILNTPELHFYVTLEALNFLASSFNVVCLSYLRAKQRSGFVVGAGLASLVVALSLNIYFIAVRHSGAVGVLYSGLISTVLATIPLGIYVLRQVKFSFSYKKLKDVVTFGAPLIITSIAAFTVNFSDRFFLRHYATISTVGVYALGYKFGFMISVLLVQPFDLIWQARIYQIAKQNPTGEIVCRVFEYYCFLLVFAALGLSLLIREFLTLVSAPSFYSAYKLVPVIALAYVFQGTNRFFLTGTYISKKTVYLGAVGLVNAAANIALNFLLIPRFGMLGAAWATACSFFFMSVLAWRVSQSVYRIPYVFSRVGMLLGLAAFLYLACNSIVLPSLAVLALFKFGVFALFPVALYLLGFFHKHEVDKGKAIALEMMGRYRLLRAEAGN